MHNACIAEQRLLIALTIVVRMLMGRGVVRRLSSAERFDLEGRLRVANST